MIGAPYKEVYRKFELTPEGIAKRAKATVNFWKGEVPLLDETDDRCETHPISNEQSLRAIDLE